MVATQLDASACLDCGAHGWRQLETHEMHGRCFFVVLAVQVFICNGVDAALTFHLDKHTVFHANQTPQFPLALVDVGVFQQHGRFPVAAIGQERGVSLDFLQDAFFFKNLFDA